MNVYLNSEIVSIEDNSSLESLLQENSLAIKKGIAVAINNRIVPKNNWNVTPLEENDKVLVISATKGG